MGAHRRTADRSATTRFEWLYVTGFVEPATGKTVWARRPTPSARRCFELVLADFAETVGPGPPKRVVLQLDNASRHAPQNLAMPDGIRLVLQPAYSRELLPAEPLWPFVDEPLANCCLATFLGTKVISATKLRNEL